MPLHEEIKRVLEVMDSVGILKPFSGCTAAEVRARMAPLEEMRKKTGTPVSSEIDHVIPCDGHNVLARVYRSELDGILPVIVYFHGGGFALGGIDSHAHICRELCIRSSAVVVSVDYRLAPEHLFPSAVEDAFSAVCWIAKNASTFGGDSSRLAVAGDSAGANLAAVSALRCRDESGPAIQFQLLIYPGTDLRGKYPSHDENAEGYFLTRDSLDWFCAQYLRDDSDRDHPWASPALASDLSNLPPALIITAEFDPLRDEGAEYAARLGKAGVTAQVSCYSGAIHGFFGAATEIGRAALSESSTALNEALRPKLASNAEQQ